MTSDSPFAVARQIRAYGDALRQLDILAQEIEADAANFNLPKNAAAEIFHRRQNGVPRCEHQRPATTTTDQPPDTTRPFICPVDALFLVTCFPGTTGTTVGDAFTQPVTAPGMTRAYCKQHAADNSVDHNGWMHSALLASADENTKQNVLRLQLARRLVRNFQSQNPAPYPHPDPFETPGDYEPPSVEKLRGIQSQITYSLRPSRFCAAPLCYDSASNYGRPA